MGICSSQKKLFFMSLSDKALITDSSIAKFASSTYSCTTCSPSIFDDMLYLGVDITSMEDMSLLSPRLGKNLIAEGDASIEAAQARFGASDNI
jgi:hypothetical protein